MNRLTSHISNNLLNSYQSAYTKHHSTESSLLAVHDHIIKSTSEQKVTALCLLDFSAAFDIINHSILLHRLTSGFGWWHSYFLAYFLLIISKLCRFYQLYFLCSVSPSSRCSTRISPWTTLTHTLHYSSQFSYQIRLSVIIYCWCHSIVHLLPGTWILRQYSTPIYKIQLI